MRQRLFWLWEEVQEEDKHHGSVEQVPAQMEDDEEREVEAAGAEWRIARGLDEALQIVVGSFNPSPPVSPAAGQGDGDSSAAT